MFFKLLSFEMMSGLLPHLGSKTNYFLEKFLCFLLMQLIAHFVRTGLISGQVVWDQGVSSPVLVDRALRKHLPLVFTPCSQNQALFVAFIPYYIPHQKILVIWLVERAGTILTVPCKMTVPGAQLIRVTRVLCSSRQNHIEARVNVFAQWLHKNNKLQGHRLHFKTNTLVIKILLKWIILSNLSNWQSCSFHSVYKANIDCFLFEAQLKIIGPQWCQNRDYALSFA